MVSALYEMQLHPSSPPAPRAAPMTTPGRRAFATRARPAPGRVDFTVMYAAHDAFDRDLSRLTEAVRSGRTADPAVRAGWATFKNQLHLHHTAEDIPRWPPL